MALVSGEGNSLLGVPLRLDDTGLTNKYEENGNRCDAALVWFSKMHERRPMVCSPERHRPSSMEDNEE